MTGSSPTRAQLRRLLALLMPRAADFAAFCLDHFPEVHGKFASGQNRDEETTILLECVEPAALFAVLCENFADVAERLEELKDRAPVSALRPLGAIEQRSRTRYLAELRTHLENLKEASIHRACFLDLNVADSPDAAGGRDPWIYRNPDSK